MKTIPAVEGAGIAAVSNLFFCVSHHLVRVQYSNESRSSLIVCLVYSCRIRLRLGFCYLNKHPHHRDRMVIPKSSTKSSRSSAGSSVSPRRNPADHSSLLATHGSRLAIPSAPKFLCLSIYSCCTSCTKVSQQKYSVKSVSLNFY